MFKVIASGISPSLTSCKVGFNGCNVTVRAKV